MVGRPLPFGRGLGAHASGAGVRAPERRPRDTAPLTAGGYVLTGVHGARECLEPRIVTPLVARLGAGAAAPLQFLPHIPRATPQFPNGLLQSLLGHDHIGLITNESFTLHACSRAQGSCLQRCGRQQPTAKIRSALYSLARVTQDRGSAAWPAPRKMRPRQRWFGKGSGRFRPYASNHYQRRGVVTRGEQRRGPGARAGRRAIRPFRAKVCPYRDPSGQVPVLRSLTTEERSFSSYPCVMT